jgi:hypothetical protein
MILEMGHFNQLHFQHGAVFLMYMAVEKQVFTPKPSRPASTIFNDGGLFFCHAN